MCAAAYYDALRECARRLQEDSRDFSAYNTVENAADIDALNKRPIEVPGLQAGATIKLDGGDLVDLVIASLYSAEMLPHLPKMIANMNSGDYRALESVFQFADFTGDSIAAGMHFAVTCAEEAAHTSADEVRAGFKSRSRLSSIFVTNGYEDLFDLCKRWGTLAVAEAQLEPVTSAIPTLVLNGKYDPVTPAEWGDLAAATLSNSYVFTFDGAGHGVAVVGQRCALSLVRAFVKNPALRQDEKCVTAKPLRFLVD